MIPTCPIHKTPMRPSKSQDGSYFCSKQMPDGAYCSERWKPAPAAAVAEIQRLEAATTPNASDSAIIKAAALQFAAAIVPYLVGASSSKLTIKEAIELARTAAKEIMND